MCTSVNTQHATKCTFASYGSEPLWNSFHVFYFSLLSLGEFSYLSLVSSKDISATVLAHRPQIRVNILEIEPYSA